MVKELLEFWDQAPLRGARFVHPQDEEKIVESGLEHKPVQSFADYVSAFKEGALFPKKFHLSLLPQPYLGDLENARVAILLLNPGVHANDFYLEQRQLDFRDELISTIRQTTKHHIFLDPKWAWTSGFGWWEKKLRGVANEIAKKKYHGRYGAALEMLAREIVSLELVPYHSASFGARKDLPSTEAAKRAALRIANDNDRTVIVMRSVSDWQLPDKTNSRCGGVKGYRRNRRLVDSYPLRARISRMKPSTDQSQLRCASV